MTSSDSFQEIVEKVIFSEGERLVELDSNKHIKRIVTLTDIFEYYLSK
jgi:hypothetical protein